MGERSALSVSVVRSARGLPVDEWDRLARVRSLYVGSEWLTFTEDADPTLDAFYVLVHDGTGALVGGLPVYLMTRPGNTRYDLRRMFADLTEGDTVLPYLVTGGVRGYDAGPLIEPTTDRSVVLDLLTTAVRCLEEEHTPGRWSLWPYLSSQDALELGSLLGSRPRLLVADCVIPLPGAGYDDYLLGLSSSRRQRSRRERRAFAEAGLRVQAIPLSDCLDRAAELLCATQRRHGYDVTTDGMRELLQAQDVAFAGRGRVHACYSGDVMVGFALMYDFGDTYYARAAGFDYDVMPAVGEYFEVTYHQPIVQSYELGLCSLHLGISAYEAKTLRGARLRPRWAVASDPAAWSDTLAREHSAQIAREVLAQVPAGLHALDLCEWGALVPEGDLRAAVERGPHHGGDIDSSRGDESGGR